MISRDLGEIGAGEGSQIVDQKLSYLLVSSIGQYTPPTITQAITWTQGPAAEKLGGRQNRTNNKKKNILRLEFQPEANHR